MLYLLISIVFAEEHYRCTDSFGWLVPFRITAKGDPECYTKDGRNCKGFSTLSECVDNGRHPENAQPLTCGSDHQIKWGSTGYEAPGHWCNKLKAFTTKVSNPVLPSEHYRCTNSFGWLVPFRITVHGDPQCYTLDGRNCKGFSSLWQCLEAGRKPWLAKPLTCGYKHKTKWGSTGYVDGHWCVKLKDFTTGNPTWYANN